MTISERQKNIVNPYPDPGLDYLFDDPRNKWVIAGIHDTYLNFGLFPPAGHPLVEQPGMIPANDVVRVEDLRAYIQVYPQNAVLRGEQLESLPRRASLAKLTQISTRLVATGVESYYTSPTSKESQLPQNQAAINGTEGVPESEILKQITSQLVSIPYSLSLTKLKQLRQAFGNPTSSFITTREEPIGDTHRVPFRGQLDTVDLYDWKKNVQAGDLAQGYYFNPNTEPRAPEGKYYFVKRTNDTEAASYDTGLIQSNEVTAQKIAAARLLGKTEILKFVGKYSATNLERVSDNLVTLQTYFDKRPGSRWIYAVSINKEIIDGNLLDDTSQNISNEDIDLTPLQKALRLIDPAQNKTLRHSTFTLKSLQDSINATLRVLKDYGRVMNIEKITPDVVSGFDIEREILKLETFYDSMSVLFRYNNIAVADDLSESVEFCFKEDMRLLYIIFSGNLYSKGMGATFLIPQQLQDAAAPATSPKAVDLFYTFGNRTFGFVFNSLQIARVVGQNKAADRPMWNQFISSYVLPRVTISPVTEAQKQQRRDFRISPPPNIFQKIDQLTDQPSAANFSTMAVTAKDLTYAVNSAMGSCDTAQSSLLKDVFQVYRMLQGEAPIWSLTKYAALRARDELIKEYINQQRFNDALRYADNPSQVARDAENWVNHEISCITGLIGGAIEDQILKPAGTPKAVNQLIRRGVLSPPLKFSFKKGVNRNLWSLWKKQIQLLLIAFIKQLIMGVIRDVMKAALGCGPEDPFKAQAGLKDYRKTKNYGRIMLNDLIEGVDLVEIADDLDLLNKQVSYTDDEERKIVTSAPRQDQLLQFNQDVSTIVTPTELGKLLDGSASEGLVNTINEMVNAGEVDTVALFGERDEIEWTDKIVVSMYQESLHAEDVRYAVLGFTKDTIVNYFIEVGNQMSPAAKAALYGTDPTTPDEAYCDDRFAIPPDIEWGVDLSDEQVRQQIQDAMDAKRWELISLCSMLEGKFNFQVQLEDFLDNIPNAGIYDAIMRWIAALSNAIADSIGDMFEDDDLQFQPKALKFTASRFGRALLEQDRQIGFQNWAIPEAIFFSPGGDPRMTVPSREYISSTTWDPMASWKQATSPGDEIAMDPDLYQRDDLGQPPLPYPEGGKIRLTMYDGPGGYYTFRVKIPNENLSPPIARGTYASRNSEQGHSLVTQPELISNLPRPSRVLYNSHFRSYVPRGESPQPPIDNYMKVVTNPSERIDQIISAFYFDPIGRARLPVTLKSFVKPYFKANDDDCVTTKEEKIAKAIMTAIEKRVAKFFMNVGPLMRMYLSWNTPDTVNAIADYMLNKTIADLKEKALYGIFLQNMDKVVEVFGKISEVDYNQGNYSMEKIIFTNAMNDEKRLAETIKQSIILVIKRQASMPTPYSAVSQNFFESGDQYEQMANAMLLQLRFDFSITDPNGMEHIQRGIDTLTRGPALRLHTTQQSTSYIRPSEINYIPPNWFSHDALYYLPVPLLTALEIIMFDKIVDPMTRYPKYKFETNSKIAIADDSVLAAVNDRFVPVFSVAYTGFPITVLGETFYTMEALELREEKEAAECAAGNAVIPRLDALIEELESKKQLVRSAYDQGLVDFAEVSATAQVDDAWTSNRGADDNDTVANAVYIQARWNQVKREVLATTRGEPLPAFDTGLDPARILGHVWTDYETDPDDDVPGVEWVWAQRHIDQTLDDYQASIHTWGLLGGTTEPEAAQEAMTRLWASMTRMATAYEDYLHVLKTIMGYGWAQISYGVYADSLAGWQPDPSDYSPGSYYHGDASPYNQILVPDSFPGLDKKWSIYRNTSWNYISSEVNASAISPTAARAKLVEWAAEECAELAHIRAIIATIKEQQRALAAPQI